MNTWAGAAPPAGEDEARLLAWTLLLPDAAAVESAAGSLAATGHTTTADGDDRLATDPWGTTVRLRVGDTALRR